MVTLMSLIKTIAYVRHVKNHLKSELLSTNLFFSELPHPLNRRRRSLPSRVHFISCFLLRFPPPTTFSQTVVNHRLNRIIVTIRYEQDIGHQVLSKCERASLKITRCGTDPVLPPIKSLRQQGCLGKRDRVRFKLFMLHLYVAPRTNILRPTETVNGSAHHRT